MKVRVDNEKWIETEDLQSLDYSPGYFQGMLKTKKGSYITRTATLGADRIYSYTLSSHAEVKKYLDFIQVGYFYTDEL